MTDLRYPTPEYHGEHGEISARLRRADEDPDLMLPNGSTVRYLGTGGSTGGRFGLYHWVLREGGAEPHFHRSFSESFFVLDGTVDIYDGERWQAAGPGDYVYVPPGGLHGFRNSSGEPASMLLLFAPGAPREAYFEGLARLAELSADERDEFFRRHDNLWVRDDDS